MVFDINGRAHDNGVREYGAQEELWELEYNEDRHKTYSSQIIWVVKFMMRWLGDVAHFAYSLVRGVLKGKDQLENLGTDRIYNGPYI